MREDVEEKFEKVLKDIVEEANQKEPRSALKSGKNEVIRRLIHMSIPITLIYYLIPQAMWGYMARETGLLIAFIFVLLFEAVRIKNKITIPGFRPYEAGRLSAAAWASIALFISFNLFPMEVVVPSVLAMGFIDPLNGELRRSKYYPWIPAGASVGIYLVCLLFLGSYNPVIILLLSVTGGLVAMASEIPHLWIDDDFMMIFTPAAVLYALIWLLTVAGVPLA